jgi:hypothetical protein
MKQFCRASAWLLPMRRLGNDIRFGVEEISVAARHAGGRTFRG